MKKTKCAWKKSILVGTNNHSFFILVDSQNCQNAQWTPPLCFSRRDDRKACMDNLSRLLFLSSCMDSQKSQLWIPLTFPVAKQALPLCMLFQNSIRQATEQTTMGRAERVPPASWLCAMRGTAAVDRGPSACSTSGPRGSSGRPSSSPAWTQVE